MRELSWSDVAATRRYVAPMRYRFSTRDRYDVFQHDFFEIFVVEEGACRTVVEGSEIRVLDTGTTGILTPGTPHEFVAEKHRPFTLFSILLNDAYVRALCSRYSEVEELSRTTSTTSLTTLELTSSQRSRINFALACLLEQPNSVFSNDLFALALFNELRQAGSGPVPIESPPWLEQSLARMRHPENLSLGVRRLVDISGRSHTHLSRTVRRHFGISPAQLIQRIRMQHAAERLVFTQAPIIEVAAECGYQSLSHFYRVFAGSYGATPRRYRNRGQLGPSSVPTIDS